LCRLLKFNNAWACCANFQHVAVELAKKHLFSSSLDSHSGHLFELAGIALVYYPGFGAGFYKLNRCCL
jgi:hypothetical protein